MNKIAIVKAFVSGQSVTDISAHYACYRATVEDVLRDAIRGLSKRVSALDAERTEQIEEIVTAAENM